MIRCKLLLAVKLKDIAWLFPFPQVITTKHVNNYVYDFVNRLYKNDIAVHREILSERYISLMPSYYFIRA